MQENKIYQTKLEAPRSAIIEGEQSGRANPFNMGNITKQAKRDAGISA